MTKRIHNDTRMVFFQTPMVRDVAYEHAINRIFPNNHLTNSQRAVAYFTYSASDMRDAYIMLRLVELGKLQPAAKLVAVVLEPAVKTIVEED